MGRHSVALGAHPLIEEIQLIFPGTSQSKEKQKYQEELHMPSNVVPTEPQALKKDSAEAGSKQKTPAQAAPAPPR